MKSIQNLFENLKVQVVLSVTASALILAGCQQPSQGGSGSSNPAPAGATAPTGGRAEMIVLRGDGSNVSLAHTEIQNSNSENILNCYLDQKGPNQILTVVGYKTEVNRNKRFLVRLELDSPLKQGPNVFQTETQSGLILISNEAPNKNVPLQEDLRGGKVAVGGCAVSLNLTNLTLDGRMSCDQVIAALEDEPLDLKIPKLHCDLQIIK